MLSKEPSGLCEERVVDGIVIFRACSFGINKVLGDSGSVSDAAKGLISLPSVGAGEGDPDGEVALLARDCGRDESKEVDEELVLSDGMWRLDGGLELGEAAGSTMIGFKSWLSTAIAMVFEVGAQDSQLNVRERQHLNCGLRNS